jgi:hypothetical protein
MRLKRQQKRELLKWVAEGLSSNEINDLAEQFNPPFSVSKQQVDYYRQTRKIDLAVIARITEQNALIEGYALKEHRVYKLSLLAALLEKDLMNGFLWLDQVKGVGAGPIAEIVEYDEFNSAEVAAYRGVLDDIAKETGGRAARQEIANPKDGDGNAIPFKIHTIEVTKTAKREE